MDSSSLFSSLPPQTHTNALVNMLCTDCPPLLTARLGNGLQPAAGAELRRPTQRLPQFPPISFIQGDVSRG